jgi:hypothetical protein
MDMFKVTVEMENRNEYVPFYSAWAACYMAEQWSKCVDVIRTIVINNETGEVIGWYDHEEMDREEDF